MYSKVEGIYVPVSQVYDSTVLCYIDSAVIFFIYRYLSYGSMIHPALHIVTNIHENGDLMIKVDISGFKYSLLGAEDLDEDIHKCYLPIYYSVEENYCTAGFCAVLRQLVKKFEADRWLLAFREACLSACAESSVWTKYCELDLIGTIKQCLKSQTSEIPVDVIRLEHHLNEPVRTHNIRKISAQFPTTNGLPDHCYMEGPKMCLPDLIIFPLIHSFFNIYGPENVSFLIPLTFKWYQLMLSDSRVSNSVTVLQLLEPAIKSSEFSVPLIKKESLYKCDPRRYKNSEKIFTKQEDINHVIRLIDSMGILAEYEYRNALESSFYWKNIPYYAHPKGGDLPEHRLPRKIQQIENIVNAVLKIAEVGDTIADFCCGTGHVGILLAYLLPQCKILLIDNKEYSLRKAAERITHLRLKNIFIIQSNVDYFKSCFQIGVTLHACGVATDLVIQSCTVHRSKFVVAPCCYGKLQINHILNYPRSERLASSSLTIRDYMVLAHSADQTHKEEYAKSDQGEKCMRIIDVDRCLHAEEHNYNVYLTKMKPETCSPKNNFLVGIPREVFQERYFK